LSTSAIADHRSEIHDTDLSQEKPTNAVNEAPSKRNNEQFKTSAGTRASSTFFSTYEATVLESHLNEEFDICHESDVRAATTLPDYAEYLPIGDQTHFNESRVDASDDAGGSREREEFEDDILDENSEQRLLASDARSMLDAAWTRGYADSAHGSNIFKNGTIDHTVLQALSDDVFTETLMHLQPSAFVNRLTSVHRELSRSKVRQLGIAPVNEIARSYSEMLMEIVTTRRSGDSKPRLADYTILLRSARDLGNHKMARHVWNALLKDGHSPDVDCYNCFMAAHVWNGRHRPQHRQRVRITPFNAKIRQREQRRAKFRTLDIGSADTLTMARHIFDTMSRDGVEPNDESYRILLMAAAHQGRMEEVKTLLRKIWGIDVNAIQRGASSATKVAQYPVKDVPERPSGALLVAIAHAFGINNDILTALRMVDHVAQQYGIPIDMEVWDQLFEWMFVLSINRTGTSKKNGSNVGQLPSQSLQSLWNTMIGEPYLVQPTMKMYDLLIKNLFTRSQTPAMVAKMMEALALYESHRDEASAAFERIKAVAAGINGDDQVANQALEGLRWEWEYLNLLRRRDVYLLKRWTSLMLKSFDEWHRMDFVDRHYACGLPAFLWKWREWAPTTVKYEMPTAFLEFDIRTKDEIVVKAQRKADAQVRQGRVLDTVPCLVGQGWL
jgi:hypothetical protein